MAEIPFGIELDPTVNINNLAASSPASSTSSSDDNDAVNTAEARVYFGPLQSPEKKLIQAVNPTPLHRRSLYPDTNGSTRRRSLRFPSSLQADSEENLENSDANDESDEAAEDISQSRSGTPDNVRFPQDEPSSVLASRIIRAHDNPSPPPRARHMPSFAPSPLKDSSLPSAHNSQSPDIDILSADIAQNYSKMFDRHISPSPQHSTISTLPSLTLRKASLSTSPEPQHSTLQRDLISFESYSPAPIFCDTQELLGSIKIAGPSSGAVQTSLYPKGTTVDDLLTRSPTASPSPRRPTSPIQFLNEMHDPLLPRSSSPVRRSPRRSPMPELPSHEPSSGTYEGPSRTSPKIPSHAVELDAALLDDRQQQPLRRSPRRSATPQYLKPLPASPPPPVPSLPAGLEASSSQIQLETPKAVESLVEVQYGAETRRKTWKGKARATSPSDKIVDDSQEMGSGFGIAGGDEKYIEGRLEAKEGRKRRHESVKDKEARMQRELGSLSPGSAKVLEQLYPSIQTMTDSAGSPKKPQDERIPGDVSEESNQSIFPSQPNPLLASIQRPPPGSPARLLSPSRAPISPSKMAIGIDLDDPTRTPARRIPIKQAIAQGTASTQKLGQAHGHLRINEGAWAGSSRSPVFTRPALDDPMRSPAKRIPISDVMSSAKKNTIAAHSSQSPRRGISIEKSGPIEPKPRNGRERSGSVEPPQRAMRLPTSTSRPSAKLPFPLIPSDSSGDQQPMSIPEENETPLSPVLAKPLERNKPVAQSSSSPAKSSLKQPSNSKIPRIGAKPYARPTSNTKGQESMFPVTAKRAGADSKSDANTARIVKPGSGSGSNSDDINIGPGSSSRAKINSKDASASANLKRKRGVEKASPPKNRPAISIRQVVPGMLGPKYAPSTPSATPSKKEPLPIMAEDSPVKKMQRPVTMRRVVDKPLENPEIVRMEEEEDAPGSSDDKPNETAHKLLRQDDTATMVSRKAKKDRAPPSPPESIPVPSQEVDIGIVDKSHSFAPEHFLDEEGSAIRVRRTTRARKQVPTNDVFTAPRPLQSRRKANLISRSEADGFSGLSSMALKALTSSNTTKNQQNFVSLATEIIRKDGRRPESPIMKVRTISQRQADEKAKGRSERAQRRAQRSDDGTSDTEGFSSDRGDSSMVEGEEEEWDEDDDKDDDDDIPRKHRRGPGDEEDYQTPAKPDRPLKRPRFGDEDVFDKEESEKEIQEKKRVKWDRGLYSEIYLDEIEVNPKKQLKEEVVKRGCLAPTAKAVRLDTLGNIINADSPLTDLIHENIVVKKFVYDNDLEPELPVVKSTRSKSRKSKN